MNSPKLTSLCFPNVEIKVMYQHILYFTENPDRSSRKNWETNRRNASSFLPHNQGNTKESLYLGRTVPEGEGESLTVLAGSMAADRQADAGACPLTHKHKAEKTDWEWCHLLKPHSQRHASSNKATYLLVLSKLSHQLETKHSNI